MYTENSIAVILSTFKSEWSASFKNRGLKELCLKLGHRWRVRVLPPAKTIELFLLQILHGNTAISALRHLSKTKFSVSAYCQARSRLPLKVLVELLGKMTSKIKSGEPRIFYVDGSTFSMPDTPELTKHFGCPSGQKKGCSFPVGHFLALFHAPSQMLTKIVPGPLYTHDISSMPKIHPALQKGDIITADRAFCSFGHVALLLAKGVNCVFRMHQLLKTGKGDVALRIVKKLGVNDNIVEWRKPKIGSRWMTREQHKSLPDIIIVRQITYNVVSRGFRTKTVTLITSLINPELNSQESIKDLYVARWSVETNFAHLKTTMKLDVLRSKTVEGVLKELYAIAIVYNMVRSVLKIAATQQSAPLSQLSFVDALRWMTFCPKSKVILIVNLNRTGRFEPRSIKRRPKQYDLLTKPRNLFNKTWTNSLS